MRCDSSIFGRRSGICVVAVRASAVVDPTTEKFVCDRVNTDYTLYHALTIEPNHGRPSIAKALRIYTQDNGKWCDCVDYVLEGRVDAVSNWEVIAEGKSLIVLIVSRFTHTLTIPFSPGAFPYTDARNARHLPVSSTFASGDPSLNYVEVLYPSHSTPYLHYKYTCRQTRSSTHRYWMLARMELAGYLLPHTGDYNLALQIGAVATQSTTCYSGEASRAIDGNKDGIWANGSVLHTCNDGSISWWMVDLGAGKQHTITSVSIYNRADCCDDRIQDMNVQILDGSDTIVASQTIVTGDVQPVYHLNFGGVQGQKVRLQKQVAGSINIAEVEVMGVSA